MKWYSSFKFKPEYGQEIFVWDAKNNRQTYLCAWCDDAWKGSYEFPLWRYCYSDAEPIRLEKNGL